MQRNVWFNKDLWVSIGEIYTIMKAQNDDLTMNKVIQMLIKKGVSSMMIGVK